MKIILPLIFLAAVIFAGCANNSSTESVHDHGVGSTHTHENGEMHQNHDTIQQQEFTVDQDSVIHDQHHHSGDSTHNHNH